jgi:hypothetical protein
MFNFRTHPQKKEHTRIIYQKMDLKSAIGRIIEARSEGTSHPLDASLRQTD